MFAPLLINISLNLLDFIGIEQLDFLEENTSISTESKTTVANNTSRKPMNQLSNY